MICTNCGTNNIEGSKFCSRCGNRLTSAPAEAHISTFNEPIEASKTSTSKTGLAVALIIACIVIIVQLVIIFILITSPAGGASTEMVIEEPEAPPYERGTIEPARELPRAPGPIPDTHDTAAHTQQDNTPAEETVQQTDSIHI